jgi:uncharacterized membrane protein YhaH (DUF805 family)
MSSAAAGTPAPASTGRKVRFGLIVLFMVLVFAQFYLAGRGVFGAGSYDAHKLVGNIAHIVSLAILIATIAVASTRNRRDIGTAVALFVLVTIQVAIGNFDHPEINAIHPFTALLIVGLGFHLISAERGATAPA